MSFQHPTSEPNGRPAHTSVTSAGIHFDRDQLAPESGYNTDTGGTTTPAYYGSSTHGRNTPELVNNGWPDRSKHELTSTNSSMVNLHLAAKQAEFDMDQEKARNADAFRAPPTAVGFKERISHVTWAWFTTTMSTGGIALVLGVTPYQFDGLRTIGKILFIFNLFLFAALTSCITTRFVLCPQALRNSLLDGHEGFFMPAFFLTISTIISNTQIYGVPDSGPWLLNLMRGVFWTYAAVTLLLAIFFYFAIWTTPHINKHLHADHMGPGWMLPIFPIMLSGTLSSVIAAKQPPEHALPIIVAGISFQGLGWFVASCLMTIFLYRLFRSGPLPQNVRPAMFMLVGPPSFTALALIGNAKVLPKDYGYFEAHPIAAEVLMIVATWAAIFLWALAFWFFCIAVVACAAKIPKMQFATPWWAFVFPNVGFTVATINVGRELGSPAILAISSVMTVFLVVMWFFVAGAQIRAIMNKSVLWPGKDEDKDQPQVKGTLPV